MKTKICNTCKVEKDITEFHKCRKFKDGLQMKCKICTNEIGKKWRSLHPGYSDAYYKTNTEHMKGNQIRRYRNRKTNEPWYIAYCTIRQRARKMNIEIDVDAQYIKDIWTDICPVLGIPLKCAVYESGNPRTKNKAKPHTNSPTIDRIDPSRGYIKGNICIMSYRANMIKNCGSIEEHKKIIDFIEKFNKSQLPVTGD